MRFIGADLHKKSITFCVVELVRGKTKLIERKRMTCCEVERIGAFLRSHLPAELVVEASIGYEWFAELAGGITDHVVIAHPAKLRIIAESTRKTDKVDAYVLAEFLAKDMIPPAWMPTPRVRQHRGLVRRRCRVQSRITSIKNTVRGLLTRYNADRRNLFTKHGWQSLEKVPLLAEDRFLLEDLQDELVQARQRLKKLDARLAEFASRAVGWELEARAVLATAPGVGPLTREVILAEIGDWTRFDNARQLVSFAGLAPGVRSSDGKRYDLKLTKAGSPLLRWILIQLAHRLKRTTARWRSLFERISRRSGRKKATCAVARRLLVTLYAMLRDGQAYRYAAHAA